MTSQDAVPVARKRFFPFANQRYCILEPGKKGKPMIGLANDVMTFLSKEWVEVDDEDYAHAVLVAKVEEDQVLARYVGDGGMWINHRPVKRNAVYSLHDGDALQMKADGTPYHVSFVEPTEILTVVESPTEVASEKSVSQAGGKTARFM